MKYMAEPGELSNMLVTSSSDVDLQKVILRVER
jgi:hypothetical protein